MKKIVSLFLMFILLAGILAVGSFSANGEELESAVVLENDGEFIKSEIRLGSNEVLHKFVLEEISDVDILVYTDIKGVRGYIYEENANAPIYDCEITTKKNDADFTTLLEPGTYYCMLKGEPCNYEIKLRATYYGNLEEKSNNTFASAEKIKKNQVKTGAITLNDRIDVYKFTLNKARKVNLWQFGTVEDSGYGLKYSIYKFNLSKRGVRRYDFLKKEQIAYNIAKDILMEDERIEYFFDDDTWYGCDSLLLEKGTYYIVVEPEHLYDNSLYKIKFKTEAPEPAMYIPHGKFNVQKLKLKAGKGVNLKVKSGKVKKWSVSNDKILSVSKTGYVRTLKKGTAYVTATLNNNKKLRCKVKVK